MARVLIAVLILMTFVSCSEKAPVNMGFVGCLSGRFSDLGTGGRNGAMLAVEELNASGGINGRQINLNVKDNQLNKDVMKNAVKAFHNEKTNIIIGPMTSAMAAAGLDYINDNKMLVLAPTVSSNLFAEQEDYFMSMTSTTSKEAYHQANQAIKMGAEKVAVLFDIKNREYTQNWGQHFIKQFIQSGGSVLDTIGFMSSETGNYSPLAERLMEKSPDGLVIIASAFDTAMLSQMLSKLNYKGLIFGCEWALTDDLIANGGMAVEGMVFSSMFDAKSETSAYLEFRDNYIKRFGHEPHFSAAEGYDAVKVIADRIMSINSADPSLLRDAIISKGEFPGLKSRIKLDRFGDAHRKFFTFRIENREFVKYGEL